MFYCCCHRLGMPSLQWQPLYENIAGMSNIPIFMLILRKEVLMYMCLDKPWLGAKGFFIFFDILDDSIICNDSVFLVRWCKWTELAQEKRYLNCVLSCSSASLKVKVAVQLANLIPLFCLSALCLSLLSQWHIHSRKLKKLLWREKERNSPWNKITECCAYLCKVCILWPVG